MIDRVRNVQEYFASAVAQAASQQRIEARAEVRAYLVRMLERFGQRDGAAPLGEPLALLLRAADGARGDRFGRYLQLGDVALFAGGFFGELFERRGISERYVRGLGRDAYLRAAALSGSLRGGVQRELLTELAERFGEWSRLLDAVRGQTAVGDSDDLTVLFERWAQARRPRHLARLVRHGVVPLDGPEGEQ